MKKPLKKLTLHRETIVQLETMAKVTTAGPFLLSDETPETHPVDGITVFPCDILVNTKPWW